MLTTAWNPLGFHLLDALPKGRISNAEYCLDDILTALLPLGPQVAGRKFTIHANNVRSTQFERVELLRRQQTAACRTPSVLA
jgi:hypothetical protein